MARDGGTAAPALVPVPMSMEPDPLTAALRSTAAAVATAAMSRGPRSGPRRTGWPRRSRERWLPARRKPRAHRRTAAPSRRRAHRTRTVRRRAAGRRRALRRRHPGPGRLFIDDADDQWTPLHIAAYNGQTTIAQVLLEAGADPFMRNIQGSTPLDYAKEKGLNPVVKAVEALPRNGSPISLRDELNSGEDWDSKGGIVGKTERLVRSYLFRPPRRGSTGDVT